jgi:hypothetical protein
MKWYLGIDNGVSGQIYPISGDFKGIVEDSP